MNRRFSRPLLIPILIAIAGIILVVSLSSQASKTAESPFSFVLAPVQEVFNSLGRAASDLLRSATEVQDLRQRAQALQQQVDVLNMENVRLREFQAEVQQYRDLLKFARDNPAYQVVGADVIGIGNAACNVDSPASARAGECANVIARDPSPFVRYLTINAGRRQGIQVGMPVVGSGLALVGRVGQVDEASSQVQLLIDPNSFVNVIAVDSRATGTASGQSDGSLHFVNVPQTDKLEPNDVIVTSGLGGTMPRLLPVGVVDRVISSDAQLFKEAVIRPAVDYNRIEVVLVITSTPAITATAR